MEKSYVNKSNYTGFENQTEAFTLKRKPHLLNFSKASGMTKILSLFFLLSFTSLQSFSSDQHAIVGWNYGNGKVMYCGLGYMMSTSSSYWGDFFQHNAEKTLFVNMVKMNSYVVNPVVGIFYSAGSTGYPNSITADTLIAILGRAGIAGVKVTSDMIDTQAEINNYNVIIMGGSGQWGGEMNAGYYAVQSVIKNFAQNDHGGVIFTGWSVFTLLGIDATDYNDMIPVEILPDYNYQGGYTLLKHLPSDPLFDGVGTVASTGYCEFPMGNIKVGAIAYGGLNPYTNPSTPADPTSIAATVNPVCSGAATQLTASGADGTVYWYTSSCGGTFVTTGNPITVNPTVSTTYYARNYNNSEYSVGCANITVTVYSPLQVPVAGSNTYAYDGTLKTASATVGVGETVDWYANATGGSTISAPSGTNVGTYSAYAETRDITTGCVSASRTLISLQITAKDIVITATAGQTKVFGTVDPAPFTYTFAPALIGTDVITGLMGRNAGENVGNYAFTIGTLTAGTNYSLSVAVAPTFSITAKAIVVTANAGQTKVFGTADPAPFTYTFAPALIGADVITGLLGRNAGENVGNYAYTIGTLTAGANYSLLVAAVPTFSITTKAIVVTANSGQTKVFGNADPAPFTYAFAPALEGTDVITGLLGRVAGENVGNYAYTIGTLTAGTNYSLSVAAAPEFSITTKAIVVTANAGQTKVFGNSDPGTYTYTFAPALIGADVISGAMGRVLGENVGNYAYTIGTLTAGSNYSLSVAAAPEFSITPKPIVITAHAGQTKVYGEADPVPFTYSFAPDLLGNDLFTGIIGRVSGENTGSYAYTIGTLTAGLNYSLSISAATQFSITQKALTVQAEDKFKCFNGVIYNGGYTVAYTGLVNGEGPEVLGGVLAYSGTAIAAIQAGTYSIIPSGLTSLNYLISYANGSLVIGVTPVPTISGDISLCAGTNGVQYTTEPGSSNYIWTISYGGTITTGLNTNQITVDWGIAGTRSITVNYDNQIGCYSPVPATHAVEVLSVPVPIINGVNSICQGSSGVGYFTQVNYDDYVWTVSSGGTITSGAGTNAITVSWMGSGDQMVSVEYTNDLGCAPIVPSVFDVFVTPLPATPVITQHGDTLTSSSVNGNQWYLNGVIIPGATEQQHIAVYKGNYTVVVTLADCSSGISNSILVLPVSVNEIEVSQSVEVYPNPNRGQFNIKVTSAETVEMNIEIFNIAGALVWKQENVTIHGTQILPVNMVNAPDGVYMVTLRNAKTNTVKRIVITR